MKKTTLTSALFALGLAGVSQGAVVFDTLGINNSGTSNNLGQSFTTGTLGAENLLNTVVLQSSSNAGGGTEDFNAHIVLYSDTDGNASTWGGTQIATSNSMFINPTVDGFSTLYTFSFAGLPALSDNTVYLLEFVNEDNAADNIRLSFGGSPTGTGGEAFRNINGGTSGAVLSGNDFSVQVNTTAVPEPSSTALLGLGGLALIMRRRK